MDYASTTPVAPEVLRAMRPFERAKFHNPSASYLDAQAVKRAIEGCRTGVARLMKCKAGEIIFTQGGTESNNLAILGLARYAVEHFDFVPHMIFSEIEHPAVSECIPVLKKLGVEIDSVGVTEKGIVDVQQLEKLVNERTVLVSVILVSNEIGTIQPLNKISSILKRYKNKNGRMFSQYPFLHTDASQALLTEEVSVSHQGADLISIDMSKVYGPKMTGVLVRKQHVPLEPLHYGGGQEHGLRSGTENAGAIAGIYEALKLANRRRAGDRARFEKLRTVFEDEISKTGIAYQYNGESQYRVPHIVNVCIPGLNSDFAVIQMDELGVNCSAMTACASAKGIPKSQIIEAIGRPECAGSSLRFSFGRDTKAWEIRKANALLKMVCAKQEILT